MKGQVFQDRLKMVIINARKSITSELHRIVTNMSAYTDFISLSIKFDSNRSHTY